VSVNVSARQFHQSDLVAMTRGALEATGLDPRRLELEITESVAMLNVEQAVATLAALRDMGVRLAFDDFGTGYASLGYLKRFPIHSLKIDQGFVRDVGQDPADAAIVRAVIEMAHALGLTAVAEGVETVEQLEFLARHGCDAFQGWLSGRPFPPGEIAGFLRGRPS
jgi:EAL domain-containing protein (putative c-di-GMP-specific phosphodiesterase class I)